ncbi:hypothetical protein KOW79_022392 [Hemibagrus wyckioides]|uniref:Uncharacterized protein n=1 Tax=Hemibagrus wyckioides TaxID=337641 RepID=A0A9D3S7B8_9TELE|nr:hypothetical protein KOW79_022392 [Hemibagrus wyckioides]
MLVKVRFGENQKYVKVAKTEEGYEDFNTFLQKVIETLCLPLQSELRLTDESGTEVDADVFEELLQAGNLTVTVSTEQSIGGLKKNTMTEDVNQKEAEKDLQMVHWGKRQG